MKSISALTLLINGIIRLPDEWHTLKITVAAYGRIDLVYWGTDTGNNGISLPDNNLGDVLSTIGVYLDAEEYEISFTDYVRECLSRDLVLERIERSHL